MPPICLQCGTAARSERAAFCVRCGLPYGAAPRWNAELPTCSVCYASAADDGRFASRDRPGTRLDLQAHLVEHEQHPVGDDDYLEGLREGALIRVGGWKAPFDLVRRYLVTGALDGGRGRLLEHNTIVTAMTQLNRFGRDVEILGDQSEWRAARDAVARLMDRYHEARSPQFA